MPTDIDIDYIYESIVVRNLLVYSTVQCTTIVIVLYIYESIVVRNVLVYSTIECSTIS